MFPFTIRDMLWLMVTAGLAVGWWLDHQLQREQYLALRGYPRSEITLQGCI